MRVLTLTLLGLGLALAACGDKDVDTGDDTDDGSPVDDSGGDDGSDSGGEDSGGEDTATGPTDACLLYEENLGCPECADGVVTCTYGEHAATEMSCGGCQAEAALYGLLCDAGITDSAAEIQSGMECALDE